jgi:hypothetical protein
VQRLYAEKQIIITFVTLGASVPNPFHVFQEDLLPAAVIKLCGPAVGVDGDSLSDFKSAVIFQKIRDAGRPE